MNITNNEIVQNSKSEPKKFSFLCTFNLMFMTHEIQGQKFFTSEILSQETLYFSSWWGVKPIQMKKQNLWISEDFYCAFEVFKKSWVVICNLYGEICKKNQFSLLGNFCKNCTRKNGKGQLARFNFDHNIVIWKCIVI